MRYLAFILAAGAIAARFRDWFGRGKAEQAEAETWQEPRAEASGEPEATACGEAPGEPEAPPRQP